MQLNLGSIFTRSLVGIQKSPQERSPLSAFWVGLPTPSEASNLPDTPLQLGTVEVYRDELILGLSSARELAVASIQKAQARYKENFDRKAKTVPWKRGDWVLVYFPQDETGITMVIDPDVSVVKVYFPQDNTIQVHQSRVKPYPSQFPSGLYWYGGRKFHQGCSPKRVQEILEECMGENTKPNDPVANVLDECMDEKLTPGEPHPKDLGDEAVLETEDLWNDDSPSDDEVSDATESCEPAQDEDSTADAAPMKRSLPCKYPLRSRSGRT